MKRISVFAMALSLTLFFACAGEKSENGDITQPEGEEMVDENASQELDSADSADEELTLE
jgi:hypothetical protein